jgi:molybdopterin synthase catalytic subunit
MLTVRVQRQDFDVSCELAKLQAASSQVGAMVSFIGLVRDINEGSSVASLELEHYPGMTEKCISAIVDEAVARWQLLGVTVIHRIGKLAPCEQIVFVASSSQHRAAAFSACEFIMDYLKTRAPFWKKELTADGERWLDSRTADLEAAQHWQD